MLRVLTLSTLFPDATRPAFGVFVDRQTQALAALPDVMVRVVAPIGLPPLVGRCLARWRGLAALPCEEEWHDLSVRRPRFATIPGIGAASAPLLARALLPVLRDVRRDFAFDVIDAQFFYPDGPAAAALGRALDVPVSIKARGADIHHWGTAATTRGQVLRAASRADGLLAVSAAMKADMGALGMAADRIAVHYTGVDLERFRPAPERAAVRTALDVSGPLLLSVGALIPRKAHHLAIEAAARLPGATLLIAGEGTERGRLEARIAALNVGDRVRLLGRVGHEALPALNAAADVAVLVSESEGLANAWVEALACGTPVVASDAGGAAELIDRPAAGRIVAREPAAIADAVSALLAARLDRHTVREAALRFTWEANALALRDHLARLVAVRR